VVYKSINVKAIREKQKLSQSKFSKEFGLNINSLKNWEQGTRTIDTSTSILFKIIEKYPNIVKEVVMTNR
jgi:putative transcriptional regulator